MKITLREIKRIIQEELKAITGGGEGSGVPTGQLAVAGVLDEKVKTYIQHLEKLKMQKEQMVSMFKMDDIKTLLFPDILPDFKGLDVKKMFKVVPREKLGKALDIYSQVGQLAYNIASAYEDAEKNFARFKEANFNDEQKKFLKQKTNDILFPNQEKKSPLSRALNYTVKNQDSVVLSDRMIVFLILEAGYNFDMVRKFFHTKQLMYKVSNAMPRKMSGEEYRAWKKELRSGGDWGR